MALHGLKRRSVARGQKPVIDEQRRAALPRGSPCDLVHHRRRAGIGFEYGADLRLAPIGRDGIVHRVRPGREDERVILVQRHHSLAPAAFGADQLAHRQRVEKFVGDEQYGRIFGHACQIVMELSAGHRRRLLGAQDGRTFHEMHARREPVALHHSQRVARQRAASRAKLDIEDILQPARTRPEIGAPQGDYLAEHLADIGRGDEIAPSIRSAIRMSARIGRAEGIAARIIARIALAHEARHRHRAIGADQAPEARSQIVALGFARLHSLRPPLTPLSLRPARGI